MSIMSSYVAAIKKSALDGAVRIKRVMSRQSGRQRLDLMREVLCAALPGKTGRLQQRLCA
jgi:hypothetical protein